MLRFIVGTTFFYFSSSLTVFSHDYLSSMFSLFSLWLLFIFINSSLLFMIVLIIFYLFSAYERVTSLNWRGCCLWGVVLYYCYYWSCYSCFYYWRRTFFSSLIFICSSFCLLISSMTYASLSLNNSLSYSSS